MVCENEDFPAGHLVGKDVGHVATGPEQEQDQEQDQQQEQTTRTSVFKDVGYVVCEARARADDAHFRTYFRVALVGAAAEGWDGWVGSPT